MNNGKTPRVDPRLYQFVVDQTRDYAVFMLDPKGQVMTWNLGAQRIKGYAPEEIIGRHFSTFYTRDALERDWPRQELKMAMAEGHFEDEGWRVRKDGSRFWANVVITALRDDDGKLLGFAKITRDLSERKAQEEVLRQSEERFRLLVEGVTDYAVFMLDPEGLVSSWNAGAARIKGYPREEILGRHFSRFYSAEDVEAGKPWEELAVARRTGRSEVEGWRIRKDGERFWARTVLTALHDTEGHLRGFAKVTQDLTHRRQIEYLEKAAQNVNEFIAMLAHELRNPLAPIRAALDVMARTPGDPRHEELRRTIERQAGQLSRIVEDMVDISRVTRGAMAMERSRVAMAEVVRAALETTRPAIEAARHHVALELPADPLWVEGDAHRLTQVVTNLLNNAARYTPPGGRIAVRLRPDGGRMALAVSDNGRGIAPELIGRIFDMFVQGRQPLQRVGGGLGVGLALARRIAELHGGTLEARSEGEDKGSEFILVLPLAQGAAVAPEERAAAESGKPALPRRVLVVDDNADAAVTLQLLLQSLGHETHVVHDGAAALEVARRLQPDVVLLDIGLPGLDGYEVARRLREMKGARPLCIIAVTGWGTDADRRRSQEAGFDLHLVKPLDPEELAQVLGRDGATLH